MCSGCLSRILRWLRTRLRQSGYISNFAATREIRGVKSLSPGHKSTGSTVQNATRLQHPTKTDAAGNAQNVTERARFLLEKSPPRDRSKPNGGTQGVRYSATCATSVLRSGDISVATS